MKEDILNGNYNDPMELDSYAISRVDDFGENVEKLSKALKESNVKYMKKKKSALNEIDKEDFKDQYPRKRNYRVVKGIREPWTEDQSFIWPDYEAEAFEKELESFRARPESNTGYNNKALNKKMTDKYGDKAKKCIKNTLFKESKIRKPLKESNESLLKQYEKDNHWEFVQSEDLEDLETIVESLRNAGATYFGKYGYEVTDKDYDNNDPKSLYIKVEGYGRRDAVNEYRISFLPDNFRGYDFFKDWCKVNHLAWSWKYQVRLENQVKKVFTPVIESVCKELGYDIEDVAFGRCRSYDNNNYVYIDIKPSRRINALNNAPADKKLQRLIDLIVKDTGAVLLAKVEDTKYWKFEGYEGAEVLFTTCLKSDEVESYPSDDEDDYENPNLGKPILYLDIPNTGYNNWNSGRGYIEDRHVKSMDDVIKRASEFVGRLKEVGKEVYKNSNY